MNNLEKVVRDDKVAVLYSPGYGAGWYTWNSEYPQLLFHPKLVELVELGQQHLIDDEWIQDNLGINNCYCGGASDLCIEWLDQGTHFIVEEYDGYETIKTFETLKLIA